ncbi:unnamed protein product, partial [Protopolystoma xenopodis]
MERGCVSPGLTNMHKNRTNRPAHEEELLADAALAKNMLACSLPANGTNCKERRLSILRKTCIKQAAHSRMKEETDEKA